MPITIREGNIEEVLSLYPFIPEFGQPPAREMYEQRLFKARHHLILIAYDQNTPVGFKVGYERDADGSFYSWMGGVAQSHRRFGIAQLLLEAMELWAKERGYHVLRFKTRNYLKPMLIFGLKNGFHIYELEPQPELKDYRILLQKELY